MEEKINELEIEGFENLPKLFILTTEKRMDEYIGSVKESNGLFKIPKPILNTEACPNKYATLQRNNSKIPIKTAVWFGFHKGQTNYNFLKSLDIAAINNEIELLHPSTHEFWEDEEIRAQFLEFLAA